MARVVVYFVVCYLPYLIPKCLGILKTFGKDILTSFPCWRYEESCHPPHNPFAAGGGGGLRAKP